jgi:hypothetical protein
MWTGHSGPFLSAFVFSQTDVANWDPTETMRADETGSSEPAPHHRWFQHGRRSSAARA